MSPEMFTSATLVWRYIERPRRMLRTRGEKASAGRITHYLMQGGVTNMERMCSMTAQEIMAIPGINKKSFQYVQEAIEDFRADYGDVKWEMPDFDDTESAYIIHEMIRRKPKHYYDLVQHFCNLAQDESKHPQMDVMERIYYKLHSIHPHEFAAIMAAKNINIEGLGLE